MDFHISEYSSRIPPEAGCTETERWFLNEDGNVGVKKRKIKGDL